MLKNMTAKNKIIASFLAFFLVSSMLCVGCNNRQKKAATTPQQSGIQKIVVTDSLERQIEIPDKIERIVVTYPTGGHIVCALGEQDKLVGIDTPSINNAFFNAIKPGFSSLPSPGSPGGVNVEELIALNPDLVIVAGRNKEIVKNLEQHGLRVFGIVAEDLEELKDSMENLGKALGREDRAAQFIKYYDETIEMVRKKTKNLQPEKKPGVYLVGSGGLLSTCSEEMYQHFLIGLAGGRNVAANEEGESTPGHGWFKISPEQLIKWNPDIIVVTQYAPGISPEQILADERFQGLNAVKNKQVFWFPSKLNSWDNPTPQAALGIKWLAKKIHPDKFQNINIEKETDDFFMMFYGKTFTDLGGSL